MNLLKSIITTLTVSFPEDPSSPSVVLSLLPTGKWYGSLVRYTERFGGGKQVLFKCDGDTLDEVLMDLGRSLGFEDEPMIAENSNG